jgi:hypothetical protein
MAAFSWEADVTTKRVRAMKDRADLVTPAGSDNAVDLSEMLFVAGLWDGRTAIHWPDPWASWARYYQALYNVQALQPGRDYVLESEP